MSEPANGKPDESPHKPIQQTGKQPNTSRAPDQTDLPEAANAPDPTDPPEAANGPDPTDPPEAANAPDPTGAPVEPDPVRAPVEPDPVRAPVEPDPVRAPIEPDPVRAPIEPDPVRAPVEPSPVRAPVEPSPVRAPVYPDPNATMVLPSSVVHPVYPGPADTAVLPGPARAPGGTFLAGARGNRTGATSPVPDNQHRTAWSPKVIWMSVAVASVLVVLGLCGALLIPVLGGHRLESPYQHPVDAATATPTEAPPPIPTTSPPSTDESDADEQGVLSAINDERAKAHCSSVNSDQRLRTSARIHSTDMATRNFFSKKGRDDSSPEDRMRQAGYDRPLDENIARGQPTAEQMVDDWMHVRRDRTNIINCDARAIGIGVAYQGTTAYWTVDFGA